MSNELPWKRITDRFMPSSEDIDVVTALTSEFAKEHNLHLDDGFDGFIQPMKNEAFELPFLFFCIAKLRESESQVLDVIKVSNPVMYSRLAGKTNKN